MTDYSKYEIPKPCDCIKNLALEISRFSNITGELEVRCRKHNILANINETRSAEFMLVWPDCPLCGSDIQYEYNTAGVLVSETFQVVFPDEIRIPTHDAEIYKIFEPCDCIKGIYKQFSRSKKDYHLKCIHPDHHKTRITREDGNVELYFKCPICTNLISLDWEYIKNRK